MQREFETLAQTGDSVLPLIVGGVMVIVLVVAFVMMRRK